MRLIRPEGFDYVVRFELTRPAIAATPAVSAGSSAEREILAKKRHRYHYILELPVEVPPKSAVGATISAR